MPGKHFTLIRSFHLADFLTIANGCCGMGSIFHAMRFFASHSNQDLWVATLLIPLAMVFDLLDGRIARWRQKASPMGRELDSLADIISFGVAPAAIAFAIGLNSLFDQVCLTGFAACGVSRLARYNITAADLSDETGKVRYYEGTPIPSSIFPLLLALFAYGRDSLFLVHIGGWPFHLVSLLFVVSGSLMLSKTIHIPKP